MFGENRNSKKTEKKNIFILRPLHATYTSPIINTPLADAVRFAVTTRAGGRAFVFRVYDFPRLRLFIVVFIYLFIFSFFSVFLFLTRFDVSTRCRDNILPAVVLPRSVYYCYLSSRTISGRAFPFRVRITHNTARSGLA